MGIFFTLYISIVAFVYPKIIDTKEKIKDISKILIDEIDKFLYIKYYFAFVVCILLFNFILFYFFKCQFWFILLNIIISVIILLISCEVFKKLEKFLFKPTSFLKPVNKFNFENERDSKKVENNLKLCKGLIIDTVTKNNYHNYDIYEICLDYITNLFIRFINTIKNNNYEKDIHNEYFELICNNLMYLNQEIIRRNTGYEIHYIFIDRYYYMIQQYNTIFLTEIIKNKLLLIYMYKNDYEPLECFIGSINFAIKHKYCKNYICDFLKELYKLLIEIDQLDSGYIFYSPLKPNTVIFDCVKNILLYCDNKNVLLNNFFDNFYKVFPLKEEFIKDIYNKRYNLSNKYLKEVLDKNEKEILKKHLKDYVANTPKYYSINLTFSLLSLLYCHKNYYLFKQLFSKADGRPNCFTRNIGTLFTCLAQYNIFQFTNKQKIDIDVDDNTYKYHILTFILIRKKDYPYYDKFDCFIDKFKNDLEIKKYYSKNLNNIKEKINKSFEELLTNTEFCQIMNIDINKKEEYRKFIDEKLNELEEIVKSNE